MVEVSGDEMVSPSEVAPPADHLLSRQRRGLAIVLVGALLVLLGAIPSRFFFRPAMPVTRLPRHELDFQVDLNQATWAELVQLPGIGPSLADRILADREQNGNFQRRSDLGRVHGIGPVILERVLPFIAVRGVSSD
jgi:competence protein ComEA